MKPTIPALLTLVALAACTSPDKVKEVDTALESKGKTTYGEVGIKDDVAIVQEEREASIELTSQEMANYNLRERVKNELFYLEECRGELASNRRELTPIPELEKVADMDAAVDEQFGKDKDGALKVVKRQGFVEKLKVERKRTELLRQTLAIAEKHRKACDRELKVVKAGG